MCLAPNHPLLTIPQPEIASINFNVGNVDRTDNKVSGKRKNKLYFVDCVFNVLCYNYYIQGAQKLSPTSTLCVVHCVSGVNYYLKG